jgi:GNAT superfamily N-acetyltransferase
VAAFCGERQSDRECRTGDDAEARTADHCIHWVVGSGGVALPLSRRCQPLLTPADHFARWCAGDAAPDRARGQPLLAAMVERLSEELSYWRFFTSKTELSPAELDYLVDVDHFAHEAIIAIDDSSGEARGVARCSRSNDDAEVAEVAVIVADDRQGRGLGRALLDR